MSGKSVYFVLLTIVHGLEMANGRVLRENTATFHLGIPLFVQLVTQST